MSDGLKRMAPRLAGLALAAAAMGAGVTGAQAQPFVQFFGWRSYDVPEMLSPELVYRRLVRTGYQPLGRIHRNGRVFLADVLDRHRRQLRLVIDSFDGTILERYVIARRAPMGVDEPPLRLEPPLTSHSLPLADPDLPPPRLLPAPPTAKAEPKTDPQPVGKTTKPRSAARQVEKEHAPAHNRAAAVPQAKPPGRTETQARDETPPATPKTETAEAAAPTPVHKPETPAKAPAPKASAPKTPAKAEGPGYANGVPINPLD